jgi:hypothetical protein
MALMTPVAVRDFTTEGKGLVLPVIGRLASDNWTKENLQLDGSGTSLNWPMSNLSIIYIREHGNVLTPGRYVGAVQIEADGVSFDEKMTELTATLHEQFAESKRLEAVINKNMEVLG